MENLNRDNTLNTDPELASQIESKVAVLPSPQAKLKKIQDLVDSLSDWQNYLRELEYLIQHDPELYFGVTNQYAIVISHYYHSRIANQILEIRDFSPTENEMQFFQRLEAVFEIKEQLIQSDQTLFYFTSNLNQAIAKIFKRK